jgi:hypothetical protein
LFGRHGHTTRCVENESISPHEYLVTRIEQTKVIEMLEEDRENKGGEI